MNKLISQLTPAGAALQDTDVIEGQLNGNAFSHKLTGLQVRSVEKTEREAQDNIIEAACGLQTDGSYLPEADSWNIRAVDFAAGCTDRGGATGGLTPSIQNALRLLDAKVKAAGSGSVVSVQSNLNADTTLTDIVPAGYLLEYIIFNEKAGNAAVLDLGTAAGGSQVFINIPIAASGLTTIPVQNMYSLTLPQTLYLNDDDASSDWNGAIVDVYFVLKAIL